MTREGIWLINRAILEALKISCFTEGIRISPCAQRELTDGGSIPLTVHEYTTTGGVTFAVDDVYINAPFDGVICEQPEALLEFDPSERTYVVTFRGQDLPARALRL